MEGTLSALAPWVRVVVGSLSFGASFFAAWIALIWWQQHRKIFHLLVSSVLSIAGLLLLLATYSYHYGWIGALMACVAIGISLYFIGRLQPSLRRFLIAGTCMTLVVSISIPLLLMWSTQQQSYQQLNNRLSIALQSLDSTQKKLGKTADDISANTSILTTLSGGFTAQNQADLRHLLVVNQLNQLTVTDPSGLVVARAQSITRNDNLVSTNPWFINALQGDTVSGTALSEKSEPSIVVVTPIMKNGAIIGGLLISQSMSQVLSTTNLSSFAIATTNGVTSFTSANQSEITVFDSATLENALAPYTAATIADESTFQFHITANDFHYRVVGISKTTLTPGQVISFSTLDPDQNNHPQPLTLALLSLLLGCTVSLGSLFLYKKLSHG